MTNSTSNKSTKSRFHLSLLLLFVFFLFSSSEVHALHVRGTFGETIALSGKYESHFQMDFACGSQLSRNFAWEGFLGVSIKEFTLMLGARTLFPISLTTPDEIFIMPFVGLALRHSQTAHYIQIGFDNSLNQAYQRWSQDTELVIPVGFEFRWEIDYTYFVLLTPARFDLIYDLDYPFEGFGFHFVALGGMGINLSF